MEQWRFNRQLDRILAIRFQPSDISHEVSVREYLRELLLALWREEEGFSGKRPFGNSGWQYDVYDALAKNGDIPGEVTYDEDGFLCKFDRRWAEARLLQVIGRLCEEPTPCLPE